MKLNQILICALLPLGGLMAQTADYPFRNTRLPLEERIDDLLSRLTLEEKVQMMKHESPAVPRLGIPAYNWWNEALHGVARTQEKVTVFPQAIGMAATFDTEALRTMGDMTSTEGRAFFNEDLKAGKTGEIYRGLTYWTPNVNIFRDPRWGRGQETYGEDPYLTAKMGAAIVQGLEGDDPFYLKAAACAKHYAVHSGPEGIRHEFDSRVTAYDLWDTYLPSFEAGVRAGAATLMSSFNNISGTPGSANHYTMTEVLKEKWGHEGFVVADWNAVVQLVNQGMAKDGKEAAMYAINAGLDMDMRVDVTRRHDKARAIHHFRVCGGEITAHFLYHPVAHKHIQGFESASFAVGDSAAFEQQNRHISPFKRKPPEGGCRCRYR